ncbi:carbon storage regulator CsrA [Anaerovorax odorimutans]|uniref:carbon storage regulator CsrA n=1 Tax=Anaerovorax odorimutans TaxID=109327 RepID=UPI000420AAC8|nr:carbon storage regulator CsrA [Anaerovorax odorimutans]
MLILTRKQGETFTIGDNIEITLLEIKGDKVKISIDAPKEIKILRKELEEAQKLNHESLLSDLSNITALKDILKKEKK